MKQRDVIASLAWLAVGCLFCVPAFRYTLFRGAVPGPGFFPFCAGIILVGLSLVALLKALRAGRPDDRKADAGFFPRPDSRKKLLFALGALLAYWLTLERLGFLIATFLFLVFLLRSIEPRKWAVALGTAFLATTLSYALFNVWLRVQLPRGLLGL